MTTPPTQGPWIRDLCSWWENRLWRGCRIARVATLDGAVTDRTESTIDLTLNAAGLRLLLGAVSHQLDRWSGGDPVEQNNLQEMKTLLTAALLECTFQDN